uniref:non-specific serine/threonine protein kinase n=1 Tax=Bionectria ochroleuca TaxID=29856 RepID=A0A0B7KHT9_BIOOC
MSPHTYPAPILKATIVKLFHRSYSNSAIPTHQSCAPLSYYCGVDAEPLYRYRPGGFHPVALGDVLNHGRYRILHKLGWGGYSTTWAAKDQQENQYVAVKISTSESRNEREVKILRAISALPNDNPGRSNLNQMLDCFTLLGPNGTHDCLVLQLLGPSVADIVESFCKGDRLPARLAKSFAQQAFQGLHCLAHHGIAHGDIHTRNLAIEIPGLNSSDEKTFLEKLGKPEIGAVKSRDGQPLPVNLPLHIIRPATFANNRILSSSPLIKIIDFGEAFSKNEPPVILHTPLPVRAPEVVFGDALDGRVDLWSAGCLLFELVTGQPPFDSIMIPADLVQQMMAFATDDLPLRWQEKWKTMEERLPIEEETYSQECYSLCQWLKEVYFDDHRQPEFTTDDIGEVGKLVSRMLKFEPSQRASAIDILASDWFK